MIAQRARCRPPGRVGDPARHRLGGDRAARARGGGRQPGPGAARDGLGDRRRRRHDRRRPARAQPVEGACAPVSARSRWPAERSSCWLVARFLGARWRSVRGLRRQSASGPGRSISAVALVALFALCALAQWVGTSIMIAGFAAGLIVAVEGGPHRLSDQVSGRRQRLPRSACSSSSSARASTSARSFEHPAELELAGAADRRDGRRPRARRRGLIRAPALDGADRDRAARRAGRRRQARPREGVLEPATAPRSSSRRSSASASARSVPRWPNASSPGRNHHRCPMRRALSAHRARGVSRRRLRGHLRVRRAEPTRG